MRSYIAASLVPSCNIARGTGQQHFQAKGESMKYVQFTRMLLASCLLCAMAGCGGGGSSAEDFTTQNASFVTWSGNDNGDLVADGASQFYRVRADGQVVSKSGAEMSGVTVRSASLYSGNTSLGSIALTQSNAGTQVAVFKCSTGRAAIIHSGSVDCASGPSLSSSSSTGGSGGSGTGGSSGTSGSNASLNVNATQCIQVTTSRGAFCGDPSSVNLSMKNTCGQTVYAHFCIERKSGSLDCGADTVGAGRTSGYWSCNDTGRYQVWGCTALGSGNCGGDPTHF